VRIEPVGSELKITSITVPLATVLESSKARRSSTGSAPGACRGAGQPQRLVIGVGQVQRSGALRPGERDAYLLSATKNQLLEARINGVSGRAIVARIISTKSGAPIDSRANNGVRTWIGRIPEDGDYCIDVVRLAPGGSSQLPYVMVVMMR
jgi:hypothetical protein